MQNVSGTFGTAPKIRVRGATSIYGSSKPLWVVDGVIMEDIVDIDADALSSGDATTLDASAIAGLNAEDIESFNILKDGSATSIYGARAMAGVIVITTKRGRAGVSSINYTGEFTYRMIPSYRFQHHEFAGPDVGLHGHAEEGLAQPGRDDHRLGERCVRAHVPDDRCRTAGHDDASRAGYLRAAEYRNTNWFKELFNNVMHTHSVSLTSGTEKSSYLCIAECHDGSRMDENQQGGALYGEHQCDVQYLQEPVAEPDLERILPQAEGSRTLRRPTT